VGEESPVKGTRSGHVPLLSSSCGSRGVNCKSHGKIETVDTFSRFTGFNSRASSPRSVRGYTIVGPRQG